LPQSLWEPTEFHVEPNKSEEYELFTSLVHIAAHLVEGWDEDMGIEVALAGVWAHAWQVTGLSPDQWEEITDRVNSQVAAVMRLIFPSLESSVA